MKRILSFYLLACIISWLLALPLVLPHFGINLLPRFYYQHALVGLGPIIAAIILISRTEGREGIYSLFRSMIRIDNKRLLLLAVFAPFLLLLLAGAIDYFRTGVQGDLSSIGKTREFPNFNRLTYFAYNLIFFGYGEEVGWKGYMLPKLQQHWTPLVSSLIFTLFWALWHLPFFFYRPGFVNMDLAGITGWLFSLLTGSILLTWFFNASKGSILVSAVFHATIDVAFVSSYTNQNIATYLGGLITVWGIAMIVFLRSRPAV